MKKKTLPMGGKYSETLIKDSLYDKLLFFMENKNLHEEDDYYYIFRGDFKTYFQYQFGCLPPNWLIKEITEKDEQKINPDTKRKRKWYRLYKKDYIYVMKELEANKKVNIFYELYNKDLSELNIDNNMWISRNSIKKMNLDIFQWMTWINIFNSLNNDRGFGKIKFDNHIFLIDKQKIQEIKNLDHHDFFKALDNNKFEKLSKSKSKNFFNTIKLLRDLFSHFWSFKINWEDEKEFRVKTFYTHQNKIAIVIDDPNTVKKYKIVVISFIDIISSIQNLAEND